MILEYNFSKNRKKEKSKIFEPYRYMDGLLVIHNYKEEEIDGTLKEVYKDIIELKKNPYQ